MMDAVKFLKTLRRMCNCECHKCEFWKRLVGFETCTVWRKTHPEEAVAILEQWAKEHPVKTRQSEFLKLFPEANVAQAECLYINPCHIFGKKVPECVYKLILPELLSEESLVYISDSLLNWRFLFY